MFSDLTLKMSEVVVELKNNIILRGNLVMTDKNLNIVLTNVKKEGIESDNMIFHNVNECFIRGNTIKYIKIKDKIDTKSLQAEILKN